MNGYVEITHRRVPSADLILRTLKLRPLYWCFRIVLLRMFQLQLHSVTYCLPHCAQGNAVGSSDQFIPWYPLTPQRNLFLDMLCFHAPEREPVAPSAPTHRVHRSKHMPK